MVWETTKSALSDSDDITTVYVLIDGHNRYTICQRNGLDFRITLKSFSNIAEVRTFMIENQLGRRNLTPEQTAYLRGLRYQEEKGAKGHYDRHRHKGQNVLYVQEIQTDESSQESNRSFLSTAQRLAKQYNVNEKTIKRDAEFAAGIDKLAPALRAEVLTGRLSTSKSSIQQLGKTNQPAGSIQSIDELMNCLSPTLPETFSSKDPVYTSNSVSEAVNSTELREKIKRLSTQIAKPSKNDWQLCDELIGCVNQLKDMFSSKAA